LRPGGLNSRRIRIRWITIFREWLGQTRELIRTKARTCFESALALNPDNVDALVGVGMVDSKMVGAGWADDRVARLASAEAALNKALSLAPNHPWAHTWMGLTYVHTRRAQQAIAEAERALALDRNLAHARGGVLATANIAIGRAEQVEGHVKDAIRLSPRDKDLYVWAMLAGMANLCLAEDDTAVTWLRRSVEANRNFPMAQFWLAAALANLGRQEDATAAVDAALALDPSVSVGRLQGGLKGMSDNPTFRAQIPHVLEGLRKAGFPEGDAPTRL
jgi:tetratricopeptide (TPR) repeat protein